jgi:hypothetical protein
MQMTGQKSVNGLLAEGVRSKGPATENGMGVEEI